MPVTHKGGTPEDIRRQVEIALSPERRRLVVTARARETLAAAEAAYRSEFGRDPDPDILVAGRVVADLPALDPDQGEIAFRFGRIGEALAWIHEQIVRHSPVLTGRYAASHILLADDRPVDPASPPPAERYVFLSTAPYGKKIEEGQSRRAPNGVYQAVAAMAARRFGNTAQIGFGYESPVLDYIAGARGRGARAALRRQPTRVRGMRLERATRVPVIAVVPA